MRVDGVVFLDKPEGLSSNAALQRVRRLYQADRGGHTGTLDPLASGILPIALGDAAKFGHWLLEADKEYIARVKLGVRTATADAEGEIVAVQPVPQLTGDSLEACLQRFRGPIEQVPPMYSALKHRGRPLYAYARRGQVVERAARPVTIHLLEILEWRGDEIALRVRCSKGTYIRVLAEDIGSALGCGAHLSGLRRTAIGPFTIDRCIALAALEALPDGERGRYVQPPDIFLSAAPRIDLTAAQSKDLQRGQVVESVQFAALPATLVRVYGPEGRFIGVAEHREGSIRARRLVRSEPLLGARAPQSSPRAE